MSNASAKIGGWGQTFPELFKSIDGQKRMMVPYLTTEHDLKGFGRTIDLQFNGWALCLLEDGRWHLEDTSGG